MSSNHIYSLKDINLFMRQCHGYNLMWLTLKNSLDPNLGSTTPHIYLYCSLLIYNLSGFICFLLTTADGTPKLSDPSLNCFVCKKNIFIKFINISLSTDRIQLNNHICFKLVYLLQTQGCDFWIGHYLIYHITKSSKKLVIHIYPRNSILESQIQIVSCR